MVKGVSAASGRLIRMSHLCRNKLFAVQNGFHLGRKYNSCQWPVFLCIVAEAVNAYRDRSSWTEYGSEGKIQ